LRELPVWVLIVIAVLWWVVYYIIQQSKEKKQAADVLKRLVGFNIRCKRTQIPIPTAEMYETIDVYEVYLSGTVSVPAEDTPCRLVIRCLDITGDISDAPIYPVLCLIPELCQEDGFVEIVEDILVPYEISTMEDLRVVTLPVLSLMCPKKGVRRIQVQAELISAIDPETSYCAGVAVVTHEQSFYGYAEQEKRSRDTDRAVVALALCVCAADGHVGKRETALIGQHFQSRLAGLEETERDKRKAAVTGVVQQFRQIRKAGGDLEKVWEKACRKIEEVGSIQAAQDAYEVCVRLVASDGQAHQAETAMLDATARRLGIPDQLAQEFRDKYWPLVIFRERGEDAGLGIPEGASREERIAFLNKEYKKWRSRAVSHNSEVAMEAGLRLKRIASARRRVEEE